MVWQKGVLKRQQKNDKGTTFSESCSTLLSLVFILQYEGVDSIFHNTIKLL